MLKNTTSPKNFPITISDREIGALNKKGMVWLFLSSLINLIVNIGVVTDRRKSAVL